jgi:hypothetical protein
MSSIKLKQYLRDAAPAHAADEYGNVYSLEGRPRRIGVMVSTGPGKVGFSIISPKEDFKEAKPAQHTITYTQNGKVHEKVINGAEKIWNANKIWEFGTNLAAKRAEGEEKNPTIIPRFIQKQVKDFENRMTRYYK